MNQKYDVMVIGPVSLDHNIDYEGNERNEIGGAVVASGFCGGREAAQKQRFSVNLIQRILRFLDVLGESGSDLYQGRGLRRSCAIKNSVFYSR